MREEYLAYLVTSMMRETSAVTARQNSATDELNRYVQLLRYAADVVDPAGVNVGVPRDKDDGLILATLVVAKADWLVTGDAAPLALADRYPIVTPTVFAARHLS